MCLIPLLVIGNLAGIPMPLFLPKFRLLPEWWGLVLTLTYLVQSVVSVYIDGRFEKKFGRTLFWVVWYPLVFWIVQAATAVAGLPRAIVRRRSPKGTWVSPDRGLA
jgi:biofilm PGA synthesis N-glycosyltransferase PgaC